MAKVKDLIGLKIGNLTVLERDYNYTKEHNLKQNRPYWKCQCTCGKIFSVCGSSLTKKNNFTKKCKECSNKDKIKDLTGLIFDNLTVLEIAGRANDRHVLYKCRCICGNETLVNGNNLITGKVRSCGCIKSYGEYKIIKLLQKNNIHFETQKTFPTCIFPNSNSLARFDFYIENNFLLEFDGIQHYKTTGSWNSPETFKKTKERDIIKNNWCYNNNIPLKRIPYWKLDSLTIDDIMTNKFLINYDGIIVEEKECTTTQTT